MQFTRPGVARHQRFERVQVIAVNNQVVVEGRLAAFQRKGFSGIRFKRSCGNAQMVSVNELFAFEIKGRHGSLTMYNQTAEWAIAVIIFRRSAKSS